MNGIARLDQRQRITIKGECIAFLGLTSDGVCNRVIRIFELLLLKIIRLIFSSRIYSLRKSYIYSELSFVFCCVFIGSLHQFNAFASCNQSSMKTSFHLNHLIS